MASKATVSNVDNQLAVMEGPIAKLADEDLAAIFKYLPPFERLIVSEVCTKWRDICQTSWRDVTHLDLSQVPTQNIHAVIKKCPILSSVSALRQNLGDLRRFVSRLRNIASLKCVECTFAIDKSALRPLGMVSSFHRAVWQELIWHKSKIVLMDSGLPVSEYLLPCASPPTLTRLQLSGVSALENGVVSIYSVLRELPRLESCIVVDAMSSIPEIRFHRRRMFSDLVCSLLETAASLRELYLDWPEASPLTRLVSKLPQLKMLYLNNVDFERTNVTDLLTQHASLCVLVITASHVSDFEGTILIPARKLFPNGFNAPPVPPLHLCLGKIAAEKLRFHPSPTDALKIYTIDAPLPEFLEKEEIKRIFEDSWIASRIKEGVKEGVNLTDYSFEGNAGSISYIE